MIERVGLDLLVELGSSALLKLWKGTGGELAKRRATTSQMPCRDFFFPSLFSFDDFTGPFFFLGHLL